MHKPRRIVLLLVLLAFASDSPGQERQTVPNIVLLVGEDMGPELGCYGDLLAKTPHIDRLAKSGVTFTRAYTHSPVCAPSRSGLITGRYPTSIGSHHMRSTLLDPPPTFTSLLRKLGYFVFWPGKTDFNFGVPQDAFDSTAKWYDDASKLPKDRPFFAYYNLPQTHESQVRNTVAVHAAQSKNLNAGERQDPAKLTLPPYYPDDPEVRRAFVQYYELATVADHEIGRVMELLRQAGILENTIVIYIGDHGRGMPRSKRWVYHQGIHVPMIVSWPGTLPAESRRDDLVCFLDLAPTLVSIAGGDVPKAWDGQVIFGPRQAPPRQHIFAARDRMDETYDRIRTVVGPRYQYIRNFHPELPFAQVVRYNEQNPTMQVWREWNRLGKLSTVQKQFFAPEKPPEELYDLEHDRDCIYNLAQKPELQETLKEMRGALDRWLIESKDLGAVPEPQLIERGLVADHLKSYEGRKKGGPPQNKPKGNKPKGT